MTVGRVVPVVSVTDLPTAVAGRRHQLSLLSRDATATVNPTVSIEVDDVDDAYRSAVAAGLRIVHPLGDEEWGVRRFFFADAAGNVVNVLSHRAQSG